MENKKKRLHLLRLLANKIRLRRFELKMTQEKLAELSHCNVNSISRIERCESVASYIMIIKIANALLVSPKELMPEQIEL